MSVAQEEIDDVIQETYLRLSRLDDVSHIRSPRAYFFSAARAVLIDRIRRQRIVRIDSLTEADELTLADSDPGPERRVSARIELERVQRLIAELPDRCREIFEMRRVQGLPQREIAERLGVPEHIVEAQAVRGLKLIMKAIARDDAERPADATRETEKSDGRQRRE